MKRTHLLSLVCVAFTLCISQSAVAHEDEDKGFTHDCDWGDATTIFNCLHVAKHSINEIWDSVVNGTTGAIADIKWFFDETEKYVLNAVEQVTSTIDMSYEAVVQVLDEENHKVIAFLGDGGACLEQSVCYEFRGGMIEFLALSATVNHELIDFYEVLPPDFPTAELAGLTEWIEEVPGYLLYPMYRAADQIDFDFDHYSVSLMDLSDDLALIKTLVNSGTTENFNEPLKVTQSMYLQSVAPTSVFNQFSKCNVWLSYHDDLATAAHHGIGVSMAVKALGVILRAAGKTFAVDASVEAISPGVIIKSSPARAFGTFFSGLGDMGLAIFSSVSSRNNQCLMHSQITDLESEVDFLKTLICDYSPWFAGNGKGNPKPLGCYKNEELN